MTCIHSGYIFAKKIKDKQGKTVAEALYKIQVKHALSMVRLVTDKGSEFNCDIMKSLCKTAMIDIEYMEPTRGFKNASQAERQNRRINSLLRRTFSLYKWTTSYLEVICSLNMATQKYGKLLTSPYELFHCRKLIVPQQGPHISIQSAFRTRMTKRKYLDEIIGRTRCLDAPKTILDQGYEMLLQPGTKVLVLREFAKKLPIELNYKISPRWQEATILSKMGQRI